MRLLLKNRSQHDSGSGSVSESVSVFCSYPFDTDTDPDPELFLILGILRLVIAYRIAALPSFVSMATMRSRSFFASVLSTGERAPHASRTS